MDNLIWWTGYFTLCALSLCLCGGVVFLSFMLANMIIECLGRYATAARQTRAFIVWIRWVRMYQKRRPKVWKHKSVKYPGQPQSGPRPTGKKPPAGD